MILICGNYGAGNFGDELILKGILNILRSLHITENEILVLSADPENTQKVHGIKAEKHLPTGIRSFFKSIKTSSIKRTIHAIKNADLILFGGGGLFNEEESYSIHLWGTHAKAFQYWKKKTIIIGQSFPEIRKSRTKKILKNCIEKAEKVIVREQESRENLQKIGIHRAIEVLADPAFFAYENQQNQSATEPINTSSKSQKIIACLRDYTKSSDGKKIQQKNIKNLLDNMQLNIEYEDFETEIHADTFEKFFQKFESAKLIIAMRLHSMILAVITGTPFIALSYTEKVKNTAKKLSFTEQVIHFPLTKEILETHIKKTFLKAESIQKQLQGAFQKEHQDKEKYQKVLTKLLN